MTRTRIKVGDVFSVQVNDFHKKLFQYVADDLTQLNSYVIRAFKRLYGNDDSLDLAEVVRDRVDFYAHVFLKNGLKKGFWRKVGNIPLADNIEVLFRGSSDSGNPQIKVSENWYVWRINGPRVKVGKLEGENQRAELGTVVTPDDILHRMRTGKYDFVYPGY